jgi:3-hydroxyacyl-[acyl-carrier-protein] dehydratase
MNTINFPIQDKTFVESLIPQKFPFVMVDEVVYFEENLIKAGFKPNTSNLFVENNTFNESGLIEHMAQSVALYTGYQFFLMQKPAPTGFIGSIKSIEINRLPKISERIETTVHILQEFMGVTLVQIIATIDNQIIAKGEMKTVLAV